MHEGFRIRQKGYPAMQNTILLSSLLIAAMLCFAPAAVRAAATHATAVVAMDASPSDLTRAHSERMMLEFGTEPKFSRYYLVDMLSQSWAVAADAEGSVRYTLTQKGNERELVID
jgi:hypothetical protein